MIPRSTEVLELALERGARLGFHRAHKHGDNPSEDAIVASVIRCQMIELHELFFIDEDEGESTRPSEEYREIMATLIREIMATLIQRLDKVEAMLNARTRAEVERYARAAEAVPPTSDHSTLAE